MKTNLKLSVELDLDLSDEDTCELLFGYLQDGLKLSLHSLVCVCSDEKHSVLNKGPVLGDVLASLNHGVEHPRVSFARAFAAFSNHSRLNGGSHISNGVWELYFTYYEYTGGYHDLTLINKETGKSKSFARRSFDEVLTTLKASPIYDELIASGNTWEFIV